MLEELDLHMKLLQQALLQFDIDAISALEGAATIQEMEGKEPDIMPREEVFLMSSFMLNVRQAAYVRSLESPEAGFADFGQHSY